MHSDPSVARLSAELEAALIRELRSAYESLNWSLFKSRLRAAPIELSDATSRLGRWVPDVRAIEISRRLVLEEPWTAVTEVLKHEMAHQYVHEVLKQTSEASHGPAFRAVCKEMGIDASASGIPAAGPATEQESRILERIARLLALAQSPNVNEAQSAMSAAQRLMLKYNLDAAKAQAPRGYSFRNLGRPTGRVAESERILAAIISEHFFVEAIWIPVYRPLEGKRGRVLEICGTKANLEMAAYVHAFLTHAAEQLWAEHKRVRGVRSNRDRRTYQAGVMVGFFEKLQKQSSAHKEEGLVWLGDAELAAYYRRRHPRVEQTYYGGQPRSEAHAHGREAGKKIVIHRPVGEGATSSRPLLPSSSR